MSVLNRDLDKFETEFVTPQVIGKIFGLDSETIVKKAREGLIPFHCFEPAGSIRLTYLFKIEEVRKTLEANTARVREYVNEGKR